MDVRSRLTSKGQITIPRLVRQRLGLRTGDDLEFVELAGEFHVRKAPQRPRFAAYRGYLKHLAGQDPDELVDDMRGK